MQKIKPLQKLALFRGELQISNFLSFFGSLKETRLTACLAYLISEFPCQIGSFFTQKEEIIFNVTIEKTETRSTSNIITNQEEATARYDITLETNKSFLVIEAKLGFRQRKEQILRYIHNLHQRNKKRKVNLILIDDGSYRSSTWIRELNLPGRMKPKFITWSEIHNQIKKCLGKTKERYKKVAWSIANEFLKYLEENGMGSDQRKEIYVRDLSGDSVSLFFKDQIYKCQPKFYKSAQGNSYFAPCFTNEAIKNFPERSFIPIEKGISWMAPIEEVQILKSNLEDVGEYLKLKKCKEYEEVAKRILIHHRESEILILKLGTPFMAFLTPITKERLGIDGNMPSACFTFAELFNLARKG